MKTLSLTTLVTLVIALALPGQSQTVTPSKKTKHRALFPAPLEAGATAQLPTTATTSVTFTWDLSPESEMINEYRLYEKGAGTWTRVASAMKPPVQLSNIPAGTHTYALTAVNFVGESLRSSEVTLPPLPAIPANLKITVTLSLP